jgi:hypothetical protein
VDPLQAGDPGQIGPFRLLGRLGEGGMGRVFLGVSTGGRRVAIKVVHPHYASAPEFRERFAREVANARQVGGFHTAAVVDADPGADPPWMATAYIPGPSLAEAIARNGPLDQAQVRQLGAALAEGVAAIHACGLIHRDLKPGNVILADDGPRIIDFGIAKGADTAALTGSNTVIGTLRYMSPEQLHAQELTPQSDIFALGTVLAYAATGHDPHDGPSIPALITSILTGPPNLEPLTGDLRDIIGSCLAKNPGDRPTPAALLAVFSPAAAETRQAAYIWPPPQPATDPAALPSLVHAARPELPTTQAPSPDNAPGTGPDPAAQEMKIPFQPSAVAPLATPPHHLAPAAKARRRPRRRAAALAAAGITAAGGLTVLAVSLSGHPPARTLLSHSSGSLPASTPAPAPTATPTAPRATVAAAASPTAPATGIVNNGATVAPTATTASASPSESAETSASASASQTPVVTGPVITAVTFSGDTSAPTVTIAGTGFGDAPPAGQSDNTTSCGDYTSNGDVYGPSGLWFVDVNNFDAGQSSSSGAACIGIVVQSWSANQVVYQFGNAYDSFAHWYITAGDQYNLSLEGVQQSGTVAFS